MLHVPCILPQHSIMLMVVEHMFYYCVLVNIYFSHVFYYWFWYIHVLSLSLGCMKVLVILTILGCHIISWYRFWSLFLWPYTALGSLVLQLDRCWSGELSNLWKACSSLCFFYHSSTFGFFLLAYSGSCPNLVGIP